jgi:pilus assembly protein CpaC
VNTQLLVSRTQTRSTGPAARWRSLAAWAALLGPSVAVAQGVGTTTVSPSRPGPSSAGPRVIEPGTSGVLPPPQPVPPPPAFPTIIPIETPAGPEAMGPERGRVINLVPDGTGLLPDRPPGPAVSRPATEAGKQVQDLVELVQEPEAEISLIAGHTKLVETRRPLTRIAIGNLAIADVELLSDQPNTRLLNLYGRGFGTTTLTLWDAENKPLTFLLRVSLDCRDLQSRIRQTYPGADIYVRQVGPQIILEGKVPDTKTMADVLTLVTTEVSISFRRYSGIGQTGAGGGGAGGMPGGAGGMTGGAGGAGGAAPGGGMAGGGFGGGAMGGAGGGQFGVAIINRVHVPGPRQVMLKVKIAELNRDAVRALGVSWFDPRNNYLLGSTVGGAAQLAGTATANQSATGLKGVLSPIASTFNAAGSAATSSSTTLFGIFHAAQFSLFLDALRANTMAKILAEPNLMTLDGQPAQFISGGLFPYPVPQSSSIPGGTAVVTVQFQQFGTILTFLPQIMANDVIRLDVEPIFSALNKGEGTTINGGVVPAIDQRRARTVVELREGQTLAIAGLLQTTTNAASVRIPGLGDLPIVGPWFSNLSTETVETELVVLVTPVLVAPMEASEVPDAPGDRVLDPNDFEFYFLGRIEGKSGVNFRSTVRELDPLNLMRHFRSENQWVIGPHGYAE